MAYLRIKTIKGRQYAYLQTSVRKGKKVKTICKYLGAIAVAPLVGVAFVSGYGTRPAPGHKSTDERAKKHQEMNDRELFDKDRAAFNAKNRGDYLRQQVAREALRAARERAMSPEEKAERAERQAEAQAKWDAEAKAVREFNEARQA